MAKAMILFLDFDGVLHPDPCFEEARLFENAPRLSAALAPYPEVAVVLSTSWRTQRTLAQLVAQHLHRKPSLVAIDGRAVDEQTGRLVHHHKGVVPKQDSQAPGSLIRRIQHGISEPSQARKRPVWVVPGCSAMPIPRLAPWTRRLPPAGNAANMRTWLIRSG